jgi:hypothetical protein
MSPVSGDIAYTFACLHIYFGHQSLSSPSFFAWSLGTPFDFHRFALFFLGVKPAVIFSVEFSFLDLGLGVVSKVGSPKFFNASMVSVSATAFCTLAKASTASSFVFFFFGFFSFPFTVVGFRLSVAVPLALALALALALDVFVSATTCCFSVSSEGSSWVTERSSPSTMNRKGKQWLVQWNRTQALDYRKYAITPVRIPQLTNVIVFITSVPPGSTIVVFIITFNNEQKRKAVVSSMELDTNKYAMSPASGDIAYLSLSQALAYRKYAITQSVFRNSPMSSSSSRAFPPVPLSSSLSLPSIMNRKGNQWLVQ